MRTLVLSATILAMSYVQATAATGVVGDADAMPTMEIVELTRDNLAEIIPGYTESPCLQEYFQDWSDIGIPKEYQHGDFFDVADFLISRIDDVRRHLGKEDFLLEILIARSERIEARIRQLDTAQTIESYRSAYHIAWVEELQLPVTVDEATAEIKSCHVDLETFAIFAEIPDATTWAEIVDHMLTP